MTDREMLALLREVATSLFYAVMTLEAPEVCQMRETLYRVRAEIAELEKRTGT